MDFKDRIAELIADLDCGLETAEITEMIEIPPNSEMGDYAFPCFRLAKTLKKAPPVIAGQLAEKIEKPDFISSLEVKGAYINFFVDKCFFVREILGEVLKKREAFGKSGIGGGKNIIIDYSSPNIAKPFHVGHLRSTVIGSSLYKIFSFLGYNAIGINHLGDWGTQFGKMIVAYKKWGDKEAVEKGGVNELNRLYVRFHDAAETDDNLNDEARSWFVKMQTGDSEALGLWKWFTDISLVELNKMYKKLGVEFDAFTGESFYNDKMDEVVTELREKNLLTESDGAMIVDLQDDNMPPCLILRRDGGTLYPTRDIAAAFYRKKTYDFDKVLYVTALDQNLHFAQWFKVIGRMGYSWEKDLVHVPFGLVSLDTGKLSTRKGNVVLMEELLDEAISKTRAIINEKTPLLENKEETAGSVGIGAVIFNDLYNSRIKDVMFSMDRMLSFDGETGPYVQYTHARACSILNKANGYQDQDQGQGLNDIDYSLITDEASVDICRLLEQYPDKIIEAANKYEPYIVTRHIVEIARAFNRFYHENNILGSDEQLKNARLSIVLCVKTVLYSGLGLLGITAPEKM